MTIHHTSARRQSAGAAHERHAALRPRRSLVALLVGVAAAAAPATASAAASATTTASRTFNYTGSSQIFQVPAGVSSIHVVAIGGSGGQGQSLGDSAAGGGRGAQVSADLPVSSGELFQVWVGAAGQTDFPVVNGMPTPGPGPGGNASGAPGAGGAGGDGTAVNLGGGGGGGASQLDDLGSNVLLAAGGGGGGGGSAPSIVWEWLGGSGGNAGAAPNDGGGLVAIGLPGGRGGGSATPDGTAGTAASPGAGGGGGGGGYPNGGGGGVGSWDATGGSGGGAGSSYVGPRASSSSITTASTAGNQNGSVTISWQQPAPVTVTLKASAVQVAQGSSVSYTATVKQPAGDPLPTGTVTFVDQNNGDNLATVAVSSASPALATFSTSALPHGTTSVYAAYRGDANYQGGASSAVSVTIYNRMLAITPTAIAFGAKPIGSTALATVTVKNTGTDPVTTGSPNVNASAYSITSSTCTGVTLNPGQTCAITVAFRPTAAGLVRGALTVPDNGTPPKAAITGTGQ